MQYIDESTVASVLHMADVIPAMRQAMIDYSQGRFSQPQRRILSVERHGGFFASMSAVAPESVGAKLASIEWAGPDAGEVDAATMSNVVIVDSREGACAESGNIRRFGAEIHAELGELLVGTRPVDPEATVVFDSLGMACQDTAAAALVFEKLVGRQDPV
ncbi:MAG: hypothetical protein ACE5IK_08730 [Acidobacteriota bacterium]